MTRIIPMMAGPTMADAVHWEWSRYMSQWTARLNDGWLLIAAIVKRQRGGPSMWSASARHGVIDLASGKFYPSADQAKEAALELWRNRLSHGVK